MEKTTPLLYFCAYLALSENSIVGQRASVFSPNTDGEAGDIGAIVDGAGHRQVENKPLEARSSILTEPDANYCYVGLNMRVSLLGNGF